MLEDWCMFYNQTIETWGEFLVTTKNDMVFELNHKSRWNTPFYCRNKANDSIASVHLLGSASNGPYYYNQNGTFFETPYRIQKSISWYAEKYGVPDRILFHTLLWDKQKVYEEYFPLVIESSNTEIWQSTIRNYEINTNKRINEIIELLREFYPSSSIELGLRTSVWKTDRCEGGLLDLMNKMTVNIAKYRNLSFYDYDRDAWSIVNFDRNYQSYLFRDKLHPNKILSVSAAKKLLNMQYTRNYYFMNMSLYSVLSNDAIVNIHKSKLSMMDVRVSEFSEFEELDSLVNNQHINIDDFHTKVLRHNQGIAKNSTYYYTHLIESGYRKIFMLEFGQLKHLFLNSGDVLSISSIDSIHKLTPRSANLRYDSIPHIFNIEIFDSNNNHHSHDDTLYHITTVSNYTYLVETNGKTHNITHLKLKGNLHIYQLIDKVFKINYIDQNIDEFWIYEYLFPHGYYVWPTEIYDEKALVKCHKHHQIFVVLNNTRHGIKSMKEFTQKGYDLDKIISHECFYINTIPEVA